MSTATAEKLDTLIIDFDSIKLVGDDSNPEVVTISEADGFFINNSVADDFRIRKSIYDMMKAAQKKLPAGYNFMIFEAYRPMARQIMLWNRTMGIMKEKYPDLNEKELHDMTETFSANPYNGIGSGHGACCAIDISLCDDNGNPYDMGTPMHIFNEATPTQSKHASAEVHARRKIMTDALEGVGFINYPPEWWHFSYGDHQWAFLVGKTEAIYGPIDI